MLGSEFIISPQQWPDQRDGNNIDEISTDESSSSLPLLLDPSYYIIILFDPLFDIPSTPFYSNLDYTGLLEWACNLDEYIIGKLTWPFTQAAIHRVDAGLSFQPAGCRLSQVATEPGVTRLSGEPLQGGVGERRHILPAPVRHIDFPEAHPRRHCGLVL